MKKSVPSKVPNGQTLVAFRESQNPKKASSYKNFRELRDEIGVVKPRPKKSKPRTKQRKHIGSSLDDLLKAEGIFEETHAQAVKEIVAWKPLKTAPRDGTELIFWVSSQKGFQDITANFYFRDGAWWWVSTEERLKRPDLVKGWMIYPQPPTR